ncbi:MAG: hypothetical protein OHK93_003689 [Ramalina farinacea]|uniref:Multiple myeloma tumor-associated protein 2-like N-terminal domain-containing protein n=1 Tax=Ramalina farinacea TaxID=258253 RepID=A0AA43QTU7_9LECA|nr:hypothetical protein [Ramalina farinacea]
MDLVAGVRKEGSRGGRADFKWSDVKDDAHRENYLGHSLMAPVGRWQQNRDLSWYANAKSSDPGSAADARREELRKVKEAEQDAMSAALGNEDGGVVIGGMPAEMVKGRAIARDTDPMTDRETDAIVVKGPGVTTAIAIGGGIVIATMAGSGACRLIDGGGTTLVTGMMLDGAGDEKTQDQWRSMLPVLRTDAIRSTVSTVVGPYFHIRGNHESVELGCTIGSPILSEQSTYGHCGKASHRSASLWYNELTILTIQTLTLRRPILSPAPSESATLLLQLPEAIN